MFVSFTPNGREEFSFVASENDEFASLFASRIGGEYSRLQVHGSIAELESFIVGLASQLENVRAQQCIHCGSIHCKFASFEHPQEAEPEPEPSDESIDRAVTYLATGDVDVYAP